MTLTDQANGTVTADAVKLVRNNTGETDTEKQDYRYLYDPNGNLTTITDAPPERGWTPTRSLTPNSTR